MTGYNHPFDVGTVLEDSSDGPNFTKFILDVTDHFSSYTYTVWTVGYASDQPRLQTSMDFDVMQDNDDYSPEWVVVYQP